MNNTPCPLCNGLEHRPVYDLSDSGGGLRIAGLIVCCETCGFWFKVPVDSESIVNAYQNGYAEDQSVERYMLSEPTRKFFREILGGLRVKSGRLLDIGSGLGAFVEEAEKAGYDAQGVDLCEPLVRKAQARGLNVQCKRAEQIEESEAFDVITMLDLIEHVPDPLALLAALRRMLKPAGELVVYTPNHRAAVVLLARLLHSLGLRFAVREIFGGNHLGFFDDHTLPAALSRAGFVVRALIMSPYDPSRPGQYVSPVSLAMITAVEQLGRPFNRMFRMLAYAQNQP